MAELSDDELILELKRRFDHTKQTLYDIKVISKKLEDVNKKLQFSEQVKSNFVSHMKNEINNPLSCILGLAQQLNAGTLDQESVIGVASSIFSEAFSLDFQLKNIFAAADFEAGETNLQPAVVDVHALVTSVLESVNHLVREKQLTVHLTPEYDENGQLLFGTDAEKLELVVLNLISNAIEFNTPGGDIHIALAIVDTHLIVKVADTGIGLDTSQLNRLFDRFVQLERGTQKTHKGHGLGLSITKAVLDIMDGTVSVDSKPGEGCAVTLSFPPVETDMEADAFSVDGNEFFFGDDQDETF